MNHEECCDVPWTEPIAILLRTFFKYYRPWQKHLSTVNPVFPVTITASNPKQKILSLLIHPFQHQSLRLSSGTLSFTFVFFHRVTVSSVSDLHLYLRIFHLKRKHWLMSPLTNVHWPLLSLYLSKMEWAFSIMLQSSAMKNLSGAEFCFIDVGRSNPVYLGPSPLQLQKVHTAFYCISVRNYPAHL